MIVIEKLTKAFGSSKVVDSADTQFEKGKVTSIIGQMELARVPYSPWLLA